MTIMGIKIASQEQKKELDKNAKRIKRKRGEYAQQRLFFQPRTETKDRKRYKWGLNKNLFPSNVVNPLTCKVPSFVDFVETKETRFFFYMLEDWDFNDISSFPIEEELACRALLHWRLRLITGNVDEEERKIIKSYISTSSKIINDSMPRLKFWPYKDGLAKFYNFELDNSYKNRNKKPNFISYNPNMPSIFNDNFKSLVLKLKPYEREISQETNLSLKEKYWTKIFKSIFDKDNIPSDLFIKTGFNFQNLDLIVSSYLAWNHNKLKKHKKEPKINLIADWKLIYSIYKELKFNSEKDPNFFDSKEIVVTSI